MDIIVLNADYTFLNFISWKKAVTLLAKERVEVVQYSKKIINTINNSFKIPSVVKLTYIVNMIYTRKVTFSKKNILIRDKYTCGYCGTKFGNSGKQRELTIDHIIPKSKGGKNEWLNCIAACKKCNNRKGDKLLEDIDMNTLWKPFTPTISQYIIQKLKILGKYKFYKNLLKEL